MTSFLRLTSWHDFLPKNVRNGGVCESIWPSGTFRNAQFGEASTPLPEKQQPPKYRRLGELSVGFRSKEFVDRRGDGEAHKTSVIRGMDPAYFLPGI